MNFLKTIVFGACAFMSLTLSAKEIIVPSKPDIAAKSYVLMDYHTGKILAQKNKDEKRSPASLTKMMTSYILGQEIEKGTVSPDDEVTISENAWAKNFSDSSKMFIEVGTKVSLDDLNHGIIIQSGNDACVAVAEYIAGSEKGFADLMNAYANNLGMKNSNFVNSHGLTNENHYTTAYDMTILGQSLIRDVPEEYAIYAKKSFTYNGIKQYNRNQLLWDGSVDVDGIKTGHTEDAGFNLTVSAVNENMRLVATVMGTDSEDARAVAAKRLLMYGFRFYETVQPFLEDNVINRARIWYGDKSEVALGVDNDVSITIPRGYANSIKSDYTIAKELNAPIKKGDVLGSVNFILEDETLATFDLVALEDVQKGGVFSRLIDFIIKFFSSLF